MDLFSRGFCARPPLSSPPVFRRVPNQFLLRLPYVTGWDFFSPVFSDDPRPATVSLVSFWIVNFALCVPSQRALPFTRRNDPLCCRPSLTPQRPGFSFLLPTAELSPAPHRAVLATSPTDAFPSPPPSGTLNQSLEVLFLGKAFPWCLPFLPDLFRLLRPSSGLTSVPQIGLRPSSGRTRVSLMRPASFDLWLIFEAMVPLLACPPHCQSIEVSRHDVLFLWSFQLGFLLRPLILFF